MAGCRLCARPWRAAASVCEIEEGGSGGIGKRDHANERKTEKGGINFYLFRSEILETIGDGLLFFPNIFLGVEKHRVFRRKI